MAFTYSLLASSTVGAGGTSAIAFNNIPQNYTDLVLVMSIRSTSTNNYGSVLFNSSSIGYTRRILYGTGSSALSTTPTGFESLTINPSDATASTFASYQMYMHNYSGGSNKSFGVDAVTENNATAATAMFHAGVWANSSSINSLTITSGVGSNSIAQHSTAYLYGIRAGEY